MNRYQQICNEWALDFEQTKNFHEAGFWRSMGLAFTVKTVFDDGAIDYAINHCETNIIVGANDDITKEAIELKQGLIELKKKLDN